MRLDRSDATPLLAILIGGALGLPGVLALRILDQEAPARSATNVVREEVVFELPRDRSAPQQEDCPSVAVSPDGRWVTYLLEGDRVVVRSLSEAADQGLPVPRAQRCVPMWSPDGSKVIFVARRGITFFPFEIDADGRARPSPDVEQPELTEER